jgi:hypothetical protein
VLLESKNVRNFIWLLVKKEQGIVQSFYAGPVCGRSCKTRDGSKPASVKHVESSFCEAAFQQQKVTDTGTDN